MAGIEIRPLAAAPQVAAVLAEIMVETVAGGGSVSFMHPLDPRTARAFWDDSLAAAERGERIVLGAWDGEALAGTVTLQLRLSPNQPHRADIAKMMTRPSHRGRGVAAALLVEAERMGVERGKTLLVLDTAVIDGAAGLYERAGFTFAGEIPDYALTPDGRLTATRYYWKRIGGPVRS
jgi:ribosomal protein S18 acetylase RimI-like enzyme